MNKTKETEKQLMNELAEARRRIVELEASEAEHKRVEEALRESEEHYRSMVESIDLGINLIDCDHNIIMVNTAQSRHFNKSPREMIGKKCFRELEKRDAVCPHCPGVEAIATGRPAEVETHGVRDDGSRFDVRLRAFPAFGRDGTVRGFVEIGQDITEHRKAEAKRKRAEKALRDEKALMDALMDNIPDSIYFKDRQCRSTRINHKMMQDLNLDDMSQGIGKTDVELFGKEFGQKTLAEDQRIIATGEPIIGLVESRQLEDGQTNWTLTTKIPLRDDSGQIVGLVGITREINELMRAEEQLQRYAAELEQANEEVKHFAYIVSHDLRAPLINLKGFAAELRSALGVIGPAIEMALPYLDEKQRQDVTVALKEDVPEALGFIDSSTTQMDRFISSLLTLSRLGRRELHPEPLDMEALVQAILQTLSHQIEERQAKVTVGPLPEVVADRTSMEQIMSNLLDNVVKYLVPDRRGEIEITAERGRDEATFHVRDNGCGIAEENMDKVFAPFRRAGRQDVPGEGMGLAYVQTLVRRHGGRIWCESELGVGTTFTFTIPNHLTEGDNYG